MDMLPTDQYWIAWDVRGDRRRVRGISRAAVFTTVMLTVLAALAGILLALTQHGTGWVGLAWAGWVLAFAAVIGRLVYDVLRGPIRR